ncbi:unnamed protein product [Ilex paraguariensis]|uniref:Uncharacterized protein n=1 Tax=Ilex paraguariensis TaxID=185542 RepID=A0ABC8TX26_9AQUA
MNQVMRAYAYSTEHILMVDIIPDSFVPKAMTEINVENLDFIQKLFWNILTADFMASIGTLAD